MLAVGMKTGAVDPFFVTGDMMQACIAFAVPDFDAAVPGSGEEMFPFIIITDAVNRFVMGIDYGDLFAGKHIPDNDFAIVSA